MDTKTVSWDFAQFRAKVDLVLERILGSAQFLPKAGVVVEGFVRGFGGLISQVTDRQDRALQEQQRGEAIAEATRLQAVAMNETLTAAAKSQISFFVRFWLALRESFLVVVTFLHGIQRLLKGVLRRGKRYTKRPPRAVALAAWSVYPSVRGWKAKRELKRLIDSPAIQNDPDREAFVGAAEGNRDCAAYLVAKWTICSFIIEPTPDFWDGVRRVVLNRAQPKGRNRFACFLYAAADLLAGWCGWVVMPFLGAALWLTGLVLVGWRFLFWRGVEKNGLYARETWGYLTGPYLEKPNGRTGTKKQRAKVWDEELAALIIDEILPPGTDDMVRTMVNIMGVGFRWTQDLVNRRPSSLTLQDPASGEAVWAKELAEAIDEGNIDRDAAVQYYCFLTGKSEVFFHLMYEAGDPKKGGAWTIERWRVVRITAIFAALAALGGAPVSSLGFWIWMVLGLATAVWVSLRYDKQTHFEEVVLTVLDGKLMISLLVAGACWVLQANPWLPVWMLLAFLLGYRIYRYLNESGPFWRVELPFPRFLQFALAPFRRLMFWASRWRFSRALILLAATLTVLALPLGGVVISSFRVSVQMGAYLGLAALSGWAVYLVVEEVLSRRSAPDVSGGFGLLAIALVFTITSGATPVFQKAFSAQQAWAHERLEQVEKAFWSGPVGSYLEEHDLGSRKAIEGKLEDVSVKGIKVGPFMLGGQKGTPTIGTPTPAPTPTATPRPEAVISNLSELVAVQLVSWSDLQGKFVPIAGVGDVFAKAADGKEIKLDLYPGTNVYTGGKNLAGSTVVVKWIGNWSGYRTVRADTGAEAKVEVGKIIQVMAREK